MFDKFDKAFRKAYSQVINESSDSYNTAKAADSLISGERERRSKLTPTQKAFEESPEAGEYDIDSWKKAFLSRSNIKKNSDGSYDVNGNVVYLLFRTDTRETPAPSKLPFKFGKVKGNFIIRSENIKTLEGCPTEVGGDFKVDECGIKDLVGAPTKVGKEFQCIECDSLKSLKGFPQYVGGNVILRSEGMDEDKLQKAVKELKNVTIEGKVEYW